MRTRRGRARRWVPVLLAALGGMAVAAPVDAAPVPVVKRAVAPAAYRSCSHATARWALARFGVGELVPGQALDPVAAVHCGPFAGAGAMFVQANNGASAGYAHLFRRQPGGVWEHVWTSAYFNGDYRASGSRIKETLRVRRPSDPRCCPSGPTKVRFWHWNGSAFVAGPFRVVGTAAPPASSGGSAEFRAPGATCGMSDRPALPKGVGVLCIAGDRSGSESATLDANGTARFCFVPITSQTVPANCLLGDAGEDTPTYGVGKTVVVGRFRCRVLATGVECVVVATGKGFLINGTKVTPVG